MKSQTNTLIYKRLGINTQHEHFIYMREDCEVCISEGFEALTRIQVSNGKKTTVASLNVISSTILKKGEIGLSESTANTLQVKEGDKITVSHLKPIESLSFVRSKIFGKELSQNEFTQIIQDIVKGKYSNVHLSAFITACAGENLNIDEIISLTNAMLLSGNKMKWDSPLIMDKHCIGGLPGNRTTPIVVSIAAAFGLSMPKTSSRAITSPAGTADTMETITNVNLNTKQIRKVVKETGGCFVWGGHANLSPADDILIKIEKALDLDTEGQLIASVLSKKAAVGSTHIIIDVPVGETAKIRNIEAANSLKIQMEKVARAIGLKLKVIITDGAQPVGRGIGPSLEARDILAVLKNEKNAPEDLRERALLLSGELIELSGEVETGNGNDIAREILTSGKAYNKFVEICKAQGRYETPTQSKYQHEVKAVKNGTVEFVDNRKLAKIAKLAGAPEDKTAGIDFLAPLGEKVKIGQTLYVIHANSTGELNYALEYQNSRKNVIKIR